MTSDTVILGSQSPRRLELLSLIIDPASILSCPPLNAEEPGFHGLTTLEQIQAQLQHIARVKNEDVTQQLAGKPFRCLLTADTVVVANCLNGFCVLGKPDGPDWKSRVRDWFQNYLCGQEHQVITAVCLSSEFKETQEFTVTTRVTFIDYEEELMEWYLETQESLGKAGGYGVQSAGSMFVKEIHGSISNVIGLPLQETHVALKKFS